MNCRGVSICVALVVLLASRVVAAPSATVPPSPIQSPSPAAAPTADPSLVQIFSGGRWCRASKQGWYRVLLPPRGPGVWVQFVRSGEGNAAVGRTIAIDELAAPDLVVAGVQVEPPPGGGCSELVIRGRVGRPTRGVVKHERFDLRVNQFGGYEIGFTPE